MDISSHDGVMDRMELVFFTPLRSRVGGPPHDDAHGAFMTLPPYAGTIVFTTETSCLAIVWATIQDIRLHPHLGVILLRSESGKSSRQPPERVVQQGVRFVRFPGEHPQCERSLFLISLLFRQTPFASCHLLAYLRSFAR